MQTTTWCCSGRVGDDLEALLLQPAGHRQPELADRRVRVVEQPPAEVRVDPGAGDDAGTVGGRAAGGELVDAAVDLARGEHPPTLQQGLHLAHARRNRRVDVIGAHGVTSSAGSR